MTSEQLLGYVIFIPFFIAFCVVGPVFMLVVIVRWVAELVRDSRSN